MALFLKVMFAIDMGFYALAALFRLLGLAPPVVEVSLWTLAFRWAITGLLLGGWIAARHLDLRRNALILLESGVVVSLAWFYALLSTSIPERTVWLMLVLITHVLMLRAALVPSHAARTSVLGLAALVMGLAEWWRSAPATPGVHFVAVAVMGASSVVITAVTSRVIYGLQRAVTSAKRLGQYELGRKLGEGGMGTVYQAKHMLLRRPTALKLLPMDRAGEMQVARFEQEVKLTSLLEHPNSVNVYDYGRTADGQFYYAMEYIDGLALDDVVETAGPLPPSRVVAILKQAASALGEAHAKGLIHRDIKPSNIMLCHRALIPDMVKVLDFGLAKVIDGDGKLTLNNTIVGTPRYLAPETINAPDDVGPGVDVYALGAVGYYLLTGEDVFDGKTIIEVCSKHLTEEPLPPSQTSTAKIPESLDKLILRCLAKNPDARYADGTELTGALDALQVPAWSEREATAWWVNEVKPRSFAAIEPRHVTIALAREAHA